MHDAEIGAPNGLLRILSTGALSGKQPEARVQIADDGGQAVFLVRQPAREESRRKPALDSHVVATQHGGRRRGGRERVVDAIGERTVACRLRGNARRHAIERGKRGVWRDAFARQ